MDYKTHEVGGEGGEGERKGLSVFCAFYRTIKTYLVLSYLREIGMEGRSAVT